MKNNRRKPEVKKPGHKKREEACASSPCRSIGTPLKGDCRSSKAFPTSPVPQRSAAGIRSRDFYSRLLYRRLSTARFGKLALAFRWRPGLSPFSPHGPSGLRLPVRRSSATEAASDPSIFPSRSSVRSPDFPGSKPFPILRPSRAKALSGRPAFRNFRSFRPGGQLRLAPPGVYLKGSRFPFESPFSGTVGWAEPDLGDMLSTTLSTLSVLRRPPVPPGGSAVWPVAFFERGIKLTFDGECCQRHIFHVYDGIFTRHLRSVFQVIEYRQEP